MSWQRPYLKTQGISYLKTRTSENLWIRFAYDGPLIEKERCVHVMALLPPPLAKRSILPHFVDDW
jgi:hypothetical protein